MNYSRFALIAIALVLFCSMPVMGVTTYLSEGPQMSAAIAGTNEFSPGQDAVISIIVENRGLNTMKTSWAGGSDPAAAVLLPDLSRQYSAWQGSGTIEREDVPTTAKVVNIALSSGNAPIVVKTGPQNIGDLASQTTATVKIATKITSDATEGEYTLPLTLRYTYLASSSQEQADILDSVYQRVNVTIPLNIKIKPSVKIEVLEAVPENLSVGTGGYINLTIKNVGFEDGKKATVKLIRNGNSPVIPTDSNVYIGDFPRNGVVTCRYKVAISSEAGNQTYPVNVAVSYENRDGDTVTSASDTVGIPVFGKLTFAVISNPISITPGSEQVITVRYQNTGTQTAYNAQARLSAVDPFTSSDNSAYLGDLKPGDVATASYRINADSGAKAQDYALDTEVRFRDALDTSQISDTFKVTISVAPSSQPTGLSAFLPILLLGALVIGAGYYLLVMRKKK
jgi:hypothetical protein